MLTYTPPSERRQTKPVEKPWVLLFLAFVWLWPGIIDRDLWAGEQDFFAATQAILAGSSVFAPAVLGAPDLAHASPVLALAALCKTLFSPWLMQGYTAARLPTVMLMAAALWCLGGAGRELLGKYNGRSVVLIAIGCPGLMILGHSMGSVPLLFAAICAFVYGVALAHRRVWSAGVLIGLSWAAAFGVAYVQGLAFLLLMTALLPLCRAWRHRSYFLASGIALCMSLPLLLVVPYALWHSDGVAFALWRDDFLFGVFGGWERHEFGFSLPSVLKNLLWFSLPAWLLALWGALRPAGLNAKTRFFCVLWFVAALAMLSLQKEDHNDLLLWLLPPLLLLAASGLDGMRRGFAAFLNWFGIMSFGAMALCVWFAFFAVNYGQPRFLAHILRVYNPYFRPQWDYFPMLLALAFTPLWLWAVTRRNIRGRQAVTNHAAGMTLVWTLLFSIFLPWADSLKSDRSAVEDMRSVMSSEFKLALATGEECISGNDKNTVLAWNEYGGVPVRYDARDCAYRLLSLRSPVYPERPGILWRDRRVKQGRRTVLLGLSPPAPE